MIPQAAEFKPVKVRPPAPALPPRLQRAFRWSACLFLRGVSINVAQAALELRSFCLYVPRPESLVPKPKPGSRKGHVSANSDVTSFYHRVLPLQNCCVPSCPFECQQETYAGVHLKSHDLGGGGRRIGRSIIFDSIPRKERQI